MRARRHHRNNLLGRMLEHSGVWVPLLLVVLFLIALALGGPSPRY